MGVESRHVQTQDRISIITTITTALTTTQTQPASSCNAADTQKQSSCPVVSLGEELFTTATMVTTLCNHTESNLHLYLPDSVVSWGNYLNSNSGHVCWVFEFPAVVLQLRFCESDGSLEEIQLDYRHDRERQDMIGQLKRDMHSLYEQYRDQNHASDEPAFRAAMIQIVGRIPMYRLPTEADQSVEYAGGWRPPVYLKLGFGGHRQVPVSCIRNPRHPVRGTFARITGTGWFSHRMVSQTVPAILGGLTPQRIMADIPRTWFPTSIRGVVREEVFRAFGAYGSALENLILNTDPTRLHELLPPGSRLEPGLAFGKLPSLEDAVSELTRPRLTFIFDTEEALMQIAARGYNSAQQPSSPAGADGEAVRMVYPRFGIRLAATAAGVLEKASSVVQPTNDGVRTHILVCATYLGRMLRTYRFRDSRPFNECAYDSVEAGLDFLVYDGRAILPCYIIEVESGVLGASSDFLTSATPPPSISPYSSAYSP